MVVFHHVGHYLPFLVGKADDLRGHNDAVGTFPQVGHADIFAAVVQYGGYLEKEPFPGA